MIATSPMQFPKGSFCCILCCKVYKAVTKSVMKLLFTELWTHLQIIFWRYLLNFFNYFLFLSFIFFFMAKYPIIINIKINVMPIKPNIIKLRFSTKLVFLLSTSGSALKIGSSWTRRISSSLLELRTSGIVEF